MSRRLLAWRPRLTTRNGKKILGLALVLLLAGVAPVLAQSKDFTGAIAEIARGTELDLGKDANFYILRLQEHPGIEFRLTPEDAERFGVVKAAGTTAVLTPKMSRGLGWKVKLACDPNYRGASKSPTYRVLSLKKLDD
jgi:hypothetical protein